MKTGEPHNLSQPERAKLGSNVILGEVSGIMNTNKIDIASFKQKVSAERLARLLSLNSEGTISTASSKSMLWEMFATGKEADTLVREQGLNQISDTQEVKEIVSQVIESNPKAVADFAAGKEPALKFLVGQVMKVTKGRANPKVVNELLKKRLEGV